MIRADAGRAPRWAPALLAFVAGGVVALAPAPVEARDACDGVWVVVDARQLGGSLTTRCAPGNPSSGLKALSGAGHAYSFVPRQPGMVCTIDQRPDPCNGAPSDAYWSYWHAESGGSWTYASRGAGNRDPQPGTVDGWAFGAGRAPGTPPPSNPEPDQGADGGDDREREPSSQDRGTDGSEDTSSTGSTDATGSAGSGGSSSADGTSESSASSSGGTSGTSAAGSAPSSDEGTATGSAQDSGSGMSEEAEGDAANARGDATDGDDTGDDGDGEGEEESERDAEEPDEDEDAPRHRIEQPSPADPDDVVALEGADRAGGRGAVGLVAGGTLVAAIAGAAALRARRRVGLDG